jgi:hypothetical protein
MTNRPFAPLPGAATDSIAATTTSGSDALVLPQPADVRQVRVYNAGAATVFIRFGETAPTALVTDLPIPAGAVEMFTIGAKIAHVAAITAAGAATVYFTTGEGN